MLYAIRILCTTRNKEDRQSTNHAVALHVADTVHFSVTRQNLVLYHFTILQLKYFLWPLQCLASPQRVISGTRRIGSCLVLIWTTTARLVIRARIAICDT